MDNSKTKKLENLEEINYFLNQNFKCFYTKESVYSSYLPYFKNLMLTMYNYIERCMKGTFSSSLTLEYVDINLFKEMFPFVTSESMFNIQTDDDIKKLGKCLKSLRDINAHLTLIKENMGVFDFDFSFLATIKPLNDKLVYYEDGLTLAGLIFFTLCFLRSESIKKMTVADKAIGLISLGKIGIDDDGDFCKKISGVTLENDIRQEHGDTILSSCLGEYLKYTHCDGENFSCILDSLHGTTFYLNGSCTNNSLTISRSATKVFYENDYTLLIIDKDDFIKRANSLPPFAFVDYLYKSNITEYTEEIDKQIQQQWKLISKLNKPKFYVEKSIDVLLMGNKNADFRIVSNCFNQSVINILLNLAYNLGFEQAFVPKEKFSFRSILEDNHFPLKLINKLILLRNFAAHDYLFGECIIRKTYAKQYNIEQSIDTLRHLLQFLEESNEELFNKTREDILSYLIFKMNTLKHKKIRESTIKYLNDTSRENLQKLISKNAWVDNSGFDMSLFNTLWRFMKIKVVLLKILIEGVDTTLYLFNTEQDRQILENYLNRENKTVIEEIKSRFVVTKKVV